MHKSTWKARERQAAGLFGAQRQPGSGSMNRSDQTRSDSTHERLFIEVKSRASHAVRTLHDATKQLAKKEGKVPILALATTGRPGLILCVHSDDLAAFLAAIGDGWRPPHQDTSHDTQT